MSHDREFKEALRVLVQGADHERSSGRWLGGLSSMDWSLPVRAETAISRPGGGAIGLYACFSQPRAEARRTASAVASTQRWDLRFTSSWLWARSR